MYSGDAAEAPTNGKGDAWTKRDRNGRVANGRRDRRERMEISRPGINRENCNHFNFMFSITNDF